MDWTLVALIAAHWAFTLLLAGLVLGAYREISVLTAELRWVVPPPTRFKKGDVLSIDLGVPLAARAFLVLVSHGCSGCVDLCQKLEGVGEQLRDRGWTLYTVVSGPLSQPKVGADGRPMPAGSPPQQMPIPSTATLIHDPSRTKFRELGASLYPTAIALVGQRIAEQRAMPSVEWFLAVDRSRRQKGEVMHGRAASVVPRGS